MKEYKKTFSSADGSDKKGDLKAPSPEEALPLLKELVEQKKSSTKKESKRKMWDFATSPHEQFDKTLDDTFMAFIMWARVKLDKEKDDSPVGDEVNVSKAFRRLESYAEWMDETGTDLIEPALTPTSVKKGLDAWHMQTSINKDGTFIWWFDMNKVDTEHVKKDVTPEESLRCFVWYSHYVMYHENAQKNGMMFVSDSANMGMIQMFTLMPMKVASKMDRLTIGVLPVKMKFMYCVNNPRWMKLMMGFFGMFMSKKMKKRFQLLDDAKKLEELLDAEVIPKGFGTIEGTLEVDAVTQEYFSS